MEAFLPSVCAVTQCALRKDHRCTTYIDSFDDMVASRVVTAAFDPLLMPARMGDAPCHWCRPVESAERISLCRPSVPCWRHEALERMESRNAECRIQLGQRRPAAWKSHDLQWTDECLLVAELVFAERRTARAVCRERGEERASQCRASLRSRHAVEPRPLPSQRAETAYRAARSSVQDHQLIRDVPLRGAGQISPSRMRQEGVQMEMKERRRGQEAQRRRERAVDDREADHEAPV
jgi:hypothetical protein